MTSPSRRPVALVVDPDRVLHHHVAEVLSSLGLSSVTAATGAEALDRLRHLAPALVLLDTDLPDMPVSYFVGRLREVSADMPVILAGTAPDDGPARPGAPEAAVTVVEKTPDLAQLWRTIESLLPGHASPGAPEPRQSVDVLPPEFNHLFRYSEKMRALETIVSRVAATDAPVLIEGEPGVGKELIAKAIHHLSARSAHRWVKVSAASLPPDLLESEMLGRQEDAERKPAKLELASGGTLFLDDVDEVPPSLQAKLVRVLENKEFFRVGGRELLAIDVRVLVATHRDLEMLVRNGAFREDLYYRLNVARIVVPPLRERRDEIPHLVEHFRETFARQYGRRSAALAEDTLDLLVSYGWPGNVRELEGMLKRYVVLGDEKHLRDELETRQRVIGGAPGSLLSPTFPGSLEIGLREIARRAAREAERIAIKEVLERVQWNRAEAARLLKISYKTLLHRLNDEGFAKKPRAGRQGKPSTHNG